MSRFAVGEVTMNSNKQVRTLATALMLVMASLAGVAGVAAAQSAGNTVQSAGNLGVGVEQADGGTAVVTVTAGNMPVEGATVDVTSEGTYTGTGTYETNADGTVSLPAPAETATVTVTATSGEQSAETTAVLEARSFANFGQRVSYFVHGLLDGTDTNGGIGQFVSEFVKKNNPSNDNKPNHAGKPDKTGKPDHAGKKAQKDKGKPDHADKSDEKKGKPEHANGDDGDDEGDEKGHNRDDHPSKGNGKGPKK